MNVPLILLTLVTILNLFAQAAPFLQAGTGWVVTNGRQTDPGLLLLRWWRPSPDSQRPGEPHEISNQVFHFG